MAAITAEQLTHAFPGVDPALITEHMGRLDARYFERFGPAEDAENLKGLSSLSSERAAALQIKVLPNGAVACTVWAVVK